MANAVLDGCDGILLGAETLRGKHPVATVETILHICKQAERCFDHKHHFDHLMNVSPPPPPSVPPLSVGNVQIHSLPLAMGRVASCGAGSSRMRLQRRQLGLSVAERRRSCMLPASTGPRQGHCL